MAPGLVVGALALSCGVERVTAVEMAPAAAEAGGPESSVLTDAAATSDSQATLSDSPVLADHEDGADAPDGEPPSEPACAMADAVCVSSNTTCMVGMYVLYDNQFDCGGATGNTCGPESAYACSN